MQLLRSEKFAATVILLAAVLGFGLANSAAHLWFDEVAHTVLFPGFGFEYFVAEFGLAFFFLLIGIELRHEFTEGTFKKPRNAVPPLLAAVFGVVFPAGLYLAVNFGTDTAAGWAIPTATDVTFAMAVFLLFGSKLPKLARTFLLTVVVADDLIAIVIIAVLFPTKLNLLALAAVLPLAALLWFVSRLKIKAYVKGLLSIGLGLAIWFAFYSSGIHPVIAGVVTGLVLTNAQGKRVEHVIWSPTNLIVLPLFAAFSAAVSIASIGEIGAIFWGIMLGPIGKVLGISLGGWMGYRIIRAKANERLSIGDLARLGALGGIGFTVALLVAQLSFREYEQLANQAVFAVLVASVVTMVLGSIALATGKRA